MALEHIIVVRHHQAANDLGPPAIKDEEVEACLDAVGLTPRRKYVDLEEKLGLLTEIDWRDARRQQAAWVDERLASDRSRNFPLAYFGLAQVPLAVDLGQRVGPWHQLHVFQRHHVLQDWRWEETAQTVEVSASGMPIAPLVGEGSAIVRVSTYCPIQPQHTRAVVADAVCEVDVSSVPTGRDCLRSQADLEAVARRVREALDRVRDFFPGLSEFHLFIAGPVGLAFRIGTLLHSPTIYGRVVLYQYDMRGSPYYRRAFALGDEVMPMVTRILFLAAQPKTAPHLRLGEELREIATGLRNGDKRDHFELEEPRLAVRHTDIQDHIRRGRAHVVHLSGHGEPDGRLLLEDSQGRGSRVHPEALRMLFETADSEHCARVVLLIACHSHHAAEALVRSPAVVPAAIATRDSVPDQASIRFSDGFYRALADGKTVSEAFKAGQTQVILEDTISSYHDTFVLHLAEGSPS